MRLYRNTRESRARRIEPIATARNAGSGHALTEAQCEQMRMRAMVQVCVVFRSRDGDGLVGIGLRTGNRGSVELRCRYGNCLMCAWEHWLHRRNKGEQRQECCPSTDETDAPRTIANHCECTH